MHNSIDLARQKLLDGGYTCVVLVDNCEYNSFERGVKPLITFLQMKRAFSGAVAADKCVGAGAAHLYVLLGVRAVWAGVMSSAAVEVLTKHGIEIVYEQVVPHIINRKGDGICPIEKAVANAKTSQEAYGRILTTLHNLGQNAKNDINNVH